MIGIGIGIGGVGHGMVETYMGRGTWDVGGENTKKKREEKQKVKNDSDWFPLKKE